jgi:hypothetical protein
LYFETYSTVLITRKLTTKEAAASPGLSRISIVVLATIKKSCNVPNDWAKKA